MVLLAQVVWLALPVMLAGIVHIAVIRRGALAALARLPLDGGVTIGGRRLLGDHKTVRGAVVMIAATMAFAALESGLAGQAAWARRLSFVDFGRVSALEWGALLGAGYVLGELPNSLVKRRLDVAPGATAPGGLRVLFWLADQLDSLVGVLLLMSVLWVPPLAVVALLVVVTLVVHPAMALAMVAVGLKTRVG